MKILFVTACASCEGDITHALLALAHLPSEITLSAASLPRGGVYEALCAMPNVEKVLPVEMGGSEDTAPHRKPGPVEEAWDFAGALRQILVFARRERADIICSIDRTVSAYLAALVSAILRRPFVLIAAYPFYGRSRRLNRWVLSRATRIVSHSDYLTEHLRPFVADSSRIVTIPDPLDMTRYHPDPAACAAQRAAWNLPSDATVVLLAGRVNEYKGHDDLVRAALKVLARYPQTRFYFCGREDPTLMVWDGVTDTYGGHTRRLIAKLGLGERVQFLGYVPDLIVAMGAADIVTMPSHEEPYGLVALEGMALGKPIVATSAGGVPSFVRPGDTGVLVPPRQPDALANALLHLLDDPPAARAMGQRAQARVKAEFDVPDYVARLVPMLRDANGERPGASNKGVAEALAAVRQEAANQKI